MKYLYFVYQWLVAVPLIILSTILFATITILGSFLGLSKFTGYYPFHFLARLFCIFFLVRVKVSGRENIDKNTSYIFVANHQSAYDIFSVYGYLNHKFYWMMKKSLEKVPFVGLACKCSGHIFVDRSSAAAIKHTMEYAQSCLKDGNSLVIFPEGARSNTGKMRKFKRGAFQLAKDFNLPLVPITIDGAIEVLHKSSFNVYPGVIKLTIHKAVDAPTTAEEADEIMNRCYATINSALSPKYKDKNL